MANRCRVQNAFVLCSTVFEHTVYIYTCRDAFLNFSQRLRKSIFCFYNYLLNTFLSLGILKKFRVEILVDTHSYEISKHDLIFVENICVSMTHLSHGAGTRRNSGPYPFQCILIMLCPVESVLCLRDFLKFSQNRKMLESVLNKSFRQ